jgi:predicted small lipoprotein YifL
MLMRLLNVLPVMFALTACGATGPLPRTPDARLADEIEAKLRNIPCVGPMDRWERHYVYSSEPSILATLMSFGTSDRWLNYQSIDIAYFQAGFEEFRGGRVLGRSRPPSADDRQYNLVFGHYDIPTHTAYIWACGPNVGGPIGDPSHPSIVVR